MRVIHLATEPGGVHPACVNGPARMGDFVIAASTEQATCFGCREAAVKASLRVLQDEPASPSGTCDLCRRKLDYHEGVRCLDCATVTPWTPP